MSEFSKEKKDIKRILLDTNFLTIPYQFNIDIFDEINRIVEEKYQLITTNGVVEELKEMVESKGKDFIAAKIGLELLKKQKVKIIRTKEENVDKSILDISNQDTIVATNDKKLRRKLKKKKVKTIFLRAKTHLELD